MKRLAWFALLGACLLLAQTMIKSETVLAQGGAPGTIFTLVNDLRSSNGLAPFVWDNRLAIAAQNQANYMAANNLYSHTGAGGSSPQSRANAAGFPGRATENIVGGTNLSPGQGVTWWQNSAIHLNTLLAPHYTHVGIAMAQGFDQNFYALVAGSPTDVVAAPAGTAPQANDQQLAPVAPIILATPNEDGSIVHSVGAGQSFWVIAARYEVPLDLLYLYNNLDENSVINPGDELIIKLAEGQEPPPTPTPPASYIVREGESWWTIAAWHKLTVPDLLWLNSATESTFLQPGDEIRIRLLPGESPPPTATPVITHIVREGETAWDIAVRYGLELNEFLELNKLNSNPVISIGQELIIVTVTTTPTATSVPSATPVLTAPAPVSTTVVATSTPINLALARDEPTPIEEAAVINSDIQERSFSAQLSLIAGAGILFIGLLAIVYVWVWLK